MLISFLVADIANEMKNKKNFIQTNLLIKTNSLCSVLFELVIKVDCFFFLHEKNKFAKKIYNWIIFYYVAK